MSAACRICLGDSEDGREHHTRCLRRLFGVPWLPSVDVRLASLHTAGLALVGRVTISGVQRKLSLSLSQDRRTLRLEVEGWQYILKPQTEAFPHLPENEHVTMRIAGLCGIGVPDHGLIALRDGSLAFIIRRFDRPPGGVKRRQEDFCQLAELPPKDKYRGSAERCGKLVRRYASEPGIALRELFGRQLFGWWTGNGDMHLKNYSLLEDDEGLFALAPAYDQLCTRLVIPRDDLALPVGGRKRNLRVRQWRELATHYGVPERAARRVAGSMAGKVEAAVDVVERSLLPGPMRREYGELLRTRGEVLGAYVRDG